MCGAGCMKDMIDANARSQGKRGDRDEWGGGMEWMAFYGHDEDMLVCQGVEVI